MSLSYVAPLSRSSCVSACCVANYMSPHIPNVVMAKQSILEFYNRKRDRLVLVDTIRMVSVIKLITDFKPYVEKDNNTCNYLFIVMDNGLVQVLKYHNGSHILYSDELKKQEPMSQGKTDSPLVAKNSDGSIILLRPATSLDIIAYVVPERRHDSVNRNDQLRATTNRHSPLSSCETGEKVSGGSLDDIFDRITTIAMFGQKVRDIAFVPNSDILATACHTGPETSFLEFSTLDSLANPKVLIKQFSHPEIHSSHGKMCPVKGPYNGLLYITEKCIFFYWNGCKNIRIRSFGNRKLHHLLHGPCCCVQVDTDRFLVNFYSGSLFLLKILGPSNLGVPTSNKVDFAYLGSIYQESYLQLLSSKYFLATSKKGHITVYRLNQKKIVPVRDVENIPPVIALDSFVDSNTDSVCLLTSCTTSTKKNPSLKLISSSLLLDDSFELEGLDGVVGIWPYENYTTGQKYVVVSYIKYSDIFRLSCSSKGQGEVELEPKQGLNFKFDRYINTLCFGTIAINFDDGSNGRVAVQITPKNIIVTDLATTDLEPWSPGWVSLGSEITLGYISKDHILVCLDSSTVCLLDATLSIIAVTEFDSPVSAMCYNNEYLAVSFWQCSEAISIYVVSKISDSFNYLCSVPSDSDHVQPELIRSIEIVGNQILIGTANGLLHRYELTVDYVAEDSEGSPSSLRHIQTWVVGSTPVTLTKFRHQIFSISDNLCILEIKIKDNDGKPITDWLTSPHRIKLDPSTGPPRSIISYDDSTFVLAFTNTLRVGDIGSFSNLYVENWPQEDVVSDICYLSEDLAFVVVLDADLTSQVKLLDVKEFKCLDTMILYSGHCLSLLLLKDLVKSDSDEMTYFVMGSFAEYPLAEDPLLESNKPHLALFTIDSTQKEIEMEDIYVNGDRVTNLTQAAEPDQLYASCASELEQFESHEWHITGVKSTGVHSPTHIVQMESSIDLRMTDSYGKEIVQSVLVVGDLLQSSLICNIDSLEPTRIIRSTSNIQTRCLGISNTQVLVGDMLGTVHQMKFNEKQLKHEATFNVREGIIANIVKASPNKKWNPVVSAQYGDIVNFQFYFTTFSGGLFFHATIKEDYSDTLKRLQNNLSYLIPFVQTNDFTNESRRHYYDYYRSVSISRSPQGINIVDGELLQEYLKLSLEGRLTCLRGQFNGGLSIKTSDNDISQMLRALRDLT